MNLSTPTRASDPPPTKRVREKSTGPFALSPPGDTLQTSRPKKESLAQITSSVRMNEFSLINNSDQLTKACITLDRSEAIGLDCETTELDPYVGRLRLTQLSNDEHTFIIDHDNFYGASGYQSLKQLLEAPKPRTVGHNSKFDQKFLLHKLGININGVFDTMLASMLVDYSPGSHNLEHVTKTYLDIRLDKTLQQSDWSGELSNNQLAYAARDSQVLLELRRTLIQRLLRDNLIRAAQLEFEAVSAVASVELAGIYLDTDLWQEQLALVKEQHKLLGDELQEMVAAGNAQENLFGDRALINLDSHPEILAALKRMGVPLDRSTKNNVLLPLAKQFPVVAQLLKYRPLSKALTSYGATWFDAISKITGRVHPDFTQIGAPTGRFSCSDPNVQQVPHPDEYRRCFRAPEGRKFCIVDYSQIELRILAHFSQDPGFLAAFQSGADLHKTTASQVFSVQIDQVTSEQRDFAKRLNFGVVYGIGAARFANMTGMSLTDAETTLRRYFQTYQTLDTYLQDISAQALINRNIRTGSGRLVRYKYDPKDKQQVSATRRQARNAPIQGTGADIFKRALRLVADDLKGTTAQIVNIIHDEIIVEVDHDDAEDIAERVSTQMVRAAEEFISSVPITAQPQITTDWVKH